MRQIKLPHLPSDIEVQQKDLMTDLWYKWDKGKEIKVQQNKQETRIQMKNIVIFGAPGSGKGTQSDLMIQHYGLEHISTGDVLRSEIKKGTELGKLAASYIDGGNLIPDDLMISILAKVYDGYGRGHKGVIFDGYPRTITQAEALEKMLNVRGLRFSAVAPTTTRRPSRSASSSITSRHSRSSSGTRTKVCTTTSTDTARWSASSATSAK